MLPIISFQDSETVGGWRRYAVSLLLPLPALYYAYDLGDPGVADAVSALMREGGIHMASAFGAAGAAALLVAGVFSTFIVPLVAFALAWMGARLPVVQLLLAWLGQSCVNTCQYLLGDAYAPLQGGVAPTLRVPGLQMLSLYDVSMAVGSVFFLVGAALFVIALLLPLRHVAVSAPAPRRSLYV